MMREKIGDAAMYEQLAEECTELAKAALKKARYLRGENPVFKSLVDIDKNLIEEYTDVMICITELDIHVDEKVFNMKMDRFADRWEKFTSSTHTTDS